MRLTDSIYGGKGNLFTYLKRNYVVWAEVFPAFNWTYFKSNLEEIPDSCRAAADQARELFCMLQSVLGRQFSLRLDPEKVSEALRAEPHVYLTHINTPRQVVIGGEKEACQRVAQALGCMHLEAPYRHAIHCEPIVSEFAAFQRLHDWPVESEPDIPVYSAAHYAPLVYDSKPIAESFAQMLTHTIDFPRLVELAYAEGARIFIELGAGSNCTKWIEAILKGRPFAAMTINQNGVDDHSALLRLLARLISQQLKTDLQALRGG